MRPCPVGPGEMAATGSYERLPMEARKYLDRLEQLLGAPITLVSIGPDREATVQRMT